MFRARTLTTFICTVVAAFTLTAADEKLNDDQRIALIRGLSAEFATAKILLPRAKKALEISSDGKYEKSEWDQAARTLGPAARVGDLVQITKDDIKKHEILFEINGGPKGRHNWYDNVE